MVAFMCWDLKIIYGLQVQIVQLFAHIHKLDNKYENIRTLNIVCVKYCVFRAVANSGIHDVMEIPYK